VFAPITPNAPTAIIKNFTTIAPSIAPILINATTKTMFPTRAPFKAPVMGNTTTPSVSASPTSSFPMQQPTNTNTGTTAPVVSERVSATIGNVEITFTGVSTIVSSSDLLQFQATIVVWYEKYFNEEQFREPDVMNMKTAMNIITQDNTRTSGSNTVTYRQDLEYDATNDARTAEDFVLLPFVNTNYKNHLLNTLKSDVRSFSGLTAISNPVIADSIIVEKSGDLSVGAILGVVVAGIFCLLLVAYAGFLIGREKSADTANGKGRQTRVYEREMINEYPNTTSLPPVQAYVDTTPVTVHLPNVATDETCRGTDPPAQTSYPVLNYKDQARSVSCPIVQAFPEPKNMVAITGTSKVEA
jgi:hypothetical protein